MTTEQVTARTIAIRNYMVDGDTEYFPYATKAVEILRIEDPDANWRQYQELRQEVITAMGEEAWGTVEKLTEELLCEPFKAQVMLIQES